MSESFVIKNIGQLVTNQAIKQRGTSASLSGKSAEAALSVLQNAWLACSQGKVVAIGASPSPADLSNWNTIDAEGGLVLPGLIDSHTHPLFAGSRAHEFVQRLQGKTYQEIALQGGGIKYTVQETRKASDAELKRLVLRRLGSMLERGVTSVEVKTGYGLNPGEEMRHLKILNQVKKVFPGNIYITCLPLHASSPEAPDNEAYIEEIITKLLPAVKREKLADAFDVFIEDGYFSSEQVEPYAQKIKELGFDFRIHADEFTAAGAAECAGKWHAQSADHLQYATDLGLKAMAEAQCIATLLPGTSLFTGIPFTNAKKIAASGCEIAVASDYNPGSCQIMNLSQIASIASIHCGLDPALALLGTTYVAAKSLNMQQFKGVLAPGFDGDILIFKSLPSWQDWLYDFGQTRPDHIFVKGVSLSSILNKSMN